MVTSELWEADVTAKDPKEGDDLATEISHFVEATLMPDPTVIDEPADGYPVVRFKVAGAAAPQGSKVAFNMKNKAGQVVGRPVMKETSKRIAQFRTDVAEMASHAMADHPPIPAPVLLDVTFVFLRPKSHYLMGGGLNKTGLATPAPVGHQLGDLSKLVRAIEDAMTGTVFRDDCEITTTTSRKRWGIHAATYITVRPDPVQG